MAVSASIGLNPVPVDLLESEFLWSQGVARKFAPPPPPYPIDPAVGRSRPVAPTC